MFSNSYNYKLYRQYIIDLIARICQSVERSDTDHGGFGVHPIELSHSTNFLQFEILKNEKTGRPIINFIGNMIEMENFFFCSILFLS